MSAHASCAGSVGGLLKNAVFGSIVSWYAEMCGAPAPIAFSTSAIAAETSCPGKPYIRSTLTRSNEASAASIALLASPALWMRPRSEEHTSELQSHSDLVCRLLLEKKKNTRCV